MWRPPIATKGGGRRYEHLVITVVTKPPLARTRWGGERRNFDIDRERAYVFFRQKYKAKKKKCARWCFKIIIKKEKEEEIYFLPDDKARNANQHLGRHRFGSVVDGRGHRHPARRTNAHTHTHTHKRHTIIKNKRRVERQNEQIIRQLTEQPMWTRRQSTENCPTVCPNVIDPNFFFLLLGTNTHTHRLPMCGASSFSFCPPLFLSLSLFPLEGGLNKRGVPT